MITGYSRCVKFSGNMPFLPSESLIPIIQPSSCKHYIKLTLYKSQYTYIRVFHFLQLSAMQQLFDTFFSLFITFLRVLLSCAVLFNASQQLFSYRSSNTTVMFGTGTEVLQSDVVKFKIFECFNPQGRGLKLRGQGPREHGHSRNKYTQYVWQPDRICYELNFDCFCYYCNF